MYTTARLHVSVWTRKRKSIFHQARDIFETANRKGVCAERGSVSRESNAAGKPKAGGKTNVKWSSGRHPESKVSDFPNPQSAQAYCILVRVCNAPSHSK